MEKKPGIRYSGNTLDIMKLYNTPKVIEYDRTDISMVRAIGVNEFEEKRAINHRLCNGLYSAVMTGDARLAATLFRKAWDNGIADRLHARRPQYVIALTETWIGDSWIPAIGNLPILWIAIEIIHGGNGRTEFPLPITTFLDSQWERDVEIRYVQWVMSIR